VEGDLRGGGSHGDGGGDHGGINFSASSGVGFGGMGRGMVSTGDGVSAYARPLALGPAHIGCLRRFRERSRYSSWFFSLLVSLLVFCFFLLVFLLLFHEHISILCIF
jgi:hypothetical protein